MKTAQDVRSNLKSSSDNGFYKVNCQIIYDNKTQGKIVIAQLVNDIEARLLSNSSLVSQDPSWKSSSYGKDWFEKNVFIEDVIWFN